MIEVKFNEKEFRKMLQEVVGSSAQDDQQKASENWMRSKDVREMLKISDSTLQTLRANGTIPAYKLDSIWFYKYNEILQILENNKK